MTSVDQLSEIISGLKDGSVVPYIGPAVLKGVTSVEGDSQIPYDSDSLILAMNNGQPMAPRLMYEFPRAAMNLELKKGRSFVERFLTDTYGNTQWKRSVFHDWLADIKPNYVIDINRDTQLQDSYKDTAHTLIVGTARITKTDYRFKIYHHDGQQYSAEIAQEDVDTSLPILFKPAGTPIPEPSYVAADADYVDYITELMGGFAIPDCLKQYRKDKKYLFIGVSMTRDTERMVLSDIIFSASKQPGWSIMPNPTDKERRFCGNKNTEIIEADWQSLLDASKNLDTEVA